MFSNYYFDARHDLDRSLASSGLVKLTRYDSVTKSLLMMELALLIRCLSTTLNHGTNGSLLEIFFGDLAMPPSLLDLSSCPAYHQVEVLTVMIIIVTHLILVMVHHCPHVVKK